MYDIAFVCFHPTHVTYFLLIEVYTPCTQGDCPQPLMFPRLTLCLWLESMAMRYST